jgi:GntR family transcriptional regulator
MSASNEMTDEQTSPALQRDSHIPLYAQIRSYFLELIQSGQLRPSDRVPSEKELSQGFEVSRMTARKAIDQLVSDGLIIRRPGKGTFVAPPLISHRISTRHSFSAAMTSLGLQHSTVVLQAGLVVAPPDVATDLDIYDGDRVVFVQRLRFVENVAVAIHSTYLQERFEPLLQQNLAGSLTQLLARHGGPVNHTRDTVEAVVASPEEAKRLAIPRGSPLIRIVGVGYTSSVEPIFHTDSLYRGDWFRFTVDSSVPSDLQPEVKRADSELAEPDEAGLLRRHQHLPKSKGRAR